MAEADCPKTAFITLDSLYEFNVMPSVLCNALATFECMMNNILEGLKRKTCFCYVDDVVVFSPEFETYLLRLEVLTCLANAKLQLNLKKCHFASRKRTTLGYVFSKEGILQAASKLWAVAEFPKPTAFSLGSPQHFVRNKLTD